MVSGEGLRERIRGRVAECQMCRMTLSYSIMSRHQRSCRDRLWTNGIKMELEHDAFLSSIGMWHGVTQIAPLKRVARLKLIVYNIDRRALACGQFLYMVWVCCLQCKQLILNLH